METSIELQERELTLKEKQLQHSIDMLELNKTQFEHKAKMEKLQALFSAREFAHSVIKNMTWGQELQKQIEQLTQEIYPISKLTL